MAHRGIADLIAALVASQQHQAAAHQQQVAAQLQQAEAHR